MLGKPDLSDERLLACLSKDFGLEVTGLTFLALGADADTAVYRAEATDGKRYFVKLRCGGRDALPVLISHWLASRGVRAIIPSIRATSGEPVASVDGFTVSLSEFVSGRDGYTRALTDDQWVMLGRALRSLHEVELPVELVGQVPQERLSPHFRRRVLGLLTAAAYAQPADDIAEQTAELLRANRPAIESLLHRADQLAESMLERGLELDLCHGDLHAGNVHIGDDGSLYLVDWDKILRAPREKDLMAIGMGGVWSGDRQADLFYEGYGAVAIDTDAIAYYRCERIIQDIDAFCTELLDTGRGEADRAQSLRYLASNFESGGLVDVALAS